MSVDWSASWTQDGTLSGTIVSPGSSDSAEYSNNPNKVHEFIVDINYGAVYDGAAIVTVVGRAADTTYETVDNGISYSVHGAVSSEGQKRIFVGPDYNAYRINVQNDSGATISISLHYKEGTLPS